LGVSDVLSTDFDENEKSPLDQFELFPVTPTSDSTSAKSVRFVDENSESLQPVHTVTEVKDQKSAPIAATDENPTITLSQVDKKTKEIERLQEVISKLEAANQALLKRLSSKGGKVTASKSPQKTKDLLDQSVKLIDRLKLEIEALQNDKQDERSTFSVQATPNVETENNSGCCIFQLPFCL
jgi:hypothetical protein